MIRFYGFSESYVSNLPTEWYWMYINAMEKIEAEETLKAMQAASFPHMEKKDSTKLLKSLRKVTSQDEQRYLTHDDMARLLNG